MVFGMVFTVDDQCLDVRTTLPTHASHTTTLRLTVGSRVLMCKCSSQNPELFLVTDMPTNVVLHETMTSCVL
jgi:hypothetical protein